MQPYPRNIKPDVNACADALNVISRLRDQDINDRNKFPSIFLSGRTVGKIPSSSSDIVPTDRVGDMSFAVDGSYAYFCVNVSGSALWRRVALGSW